MVVDWFDLLKDEDPNEFRTGVIPQHELPEGFDPAAAYDYETNTFMIPGGVYSRIAERQGQEVFESELLNTLIHEAVHQAQFNLDDQVIAERKRAGRELERTMAKISEYFRDDISTTDRAVANPRYLITPNVSYNRNQNRRRGQKNTSQRKVFTDEVTKIIREDLNKLLPIVDKQIEEILKFNILIETQAYLVTEPYRTEIADFSERGTVDREYMYNMIDAIAGSAVMPALALTHVTIRLLKNISRYANPQLMKYIRQKSTPFKNKLEELPTKSNNYAKSIVNNVLLKIQEKFPQFKQEYKTGGKFVRKTAEKERDKWMDILKGGCGCGCPGDEEKEDLETVDKSSARCTKRTKKTSSTRKNKKYMACVPNGKGGYKRVHWGDPNAKVTGKSGNTGRKKNFRARHNCDSCKRSDYSARCMACRDW